jgi:pimeloyl-ACP methyl ester carboxylesterase
MFINYSNKEENIPLIAETVRKKSVIKKILSITGILVSVITIFGAWFMTTLIMEQDINNLPSWHPFTSLENRYLYTRYYNKRAKNWPVNSETKFINTSYGKTFIRISGPADAPPLVLLPSVGASSLMWIPNIKTLAEHFRVYAVDNVYDAGLSVYTRQVKKTADAVAWMDELFTGIGLKNNINLMGLSLGGWYTAQYALNFPQKLNKVIMLAPAGTVAPITYSFIWRAIIAAIPHRFFSENMVKWAFGVLAERKDPESQKLFNDIVDDSFMGIKCFKFKMPVEPTVLTDEELGSIKVPALFLLGNREVIYPANEAIMRLNKVAPQIETCIIPDASHDLTFVQPELINTKVIEFIKK